MKINVPEKHSHLETGSAEIISGDARAVLMAHLFHDWIIESFTISFGGESNRMIIIDCLTCRQHGKIGDFSLL